MSEHKAIIHWKRVGEGFLEGRYSREHSWTFDGGLTVPASPSPAVVRAPYSNPNNIDPEEAFVAALSSCHMLTYLYLASKAAFQIDEYHDEAVGLMSKNEAGVAWISDINLRVRVRYSGATLPTAADEERLHHEAHQQCFLANSVMTKIRVEPLPSGVQ